MSRGQPIRVEDLPAPMASLKKNGSSPTAALEKNITDWVEKEKASSTSEEHSEATQTNDLHDRFLSTVEPPLLREALRQCDHNRAAAAQLLGIHRTTLRQKLRKYGIE